MTRTRIQNGSNPIRQPDSIASTLTFSLGLCTLLTQQHTWMTIRDQTFHLLDLPQMHNCPNLWPNNHIHPLFFFFLCVVVIKHPSNLYYQKNHKWPVNEVFFFFKFKCTGLFFTHVLLVFLK